MYNKMMVTAREVFSTLVTRLLEQQVVLNDLNSANYAPIVTIITPELRINLGDSSLETTLGSEGKWQKLDVKSISNTDLLGQWCEALQKRTAVVKQQVQAQRQYLDCVAAKFQGYLQ